MEKKPIPGFSRYEASSDGTISNKQTGTVIAYVGDSVRLTNDKGERKYYKRSEAEALFVVKNEVSKDEIDALPSEKKSAKKKTEAKVKPAPEPKKPVAKPIKEAKDKSQFYVEIVPGKDGAEGWSVQKLKKTQAEHFLAGHVRSQSLTKKINECKKENATITKNEVIRELIAENFPYIDIAILCEVRPARIHNVINKYKTKKQLAKEAKK